MSRDETITVVNEFQSPSSEDRERIITELLEDGENELWSINLSPYQARLFVSRMLETGRFERFDGMSGFQKQRFAILHSNGAECDFLLQLDQLDPGLEIRLLHVASNESFEEFQEIMTYHFGASISEDLQIALHQYFVIYGEEDYEDNYGEYRINSYDIDNLGDPATEDIFLAHTSIILSREFGEDKVIPLIERINAGENISAYELLKIVRSGTQLRDSTPLSWIAELL